MKRHLPSIIALLLITLLLGCQSQPDEPVESANPGAEQPLDPSESEVESSTVPEPSAEPSAAWQIVKQIQPEHKPKYAAFMNELFGATGCGEKFVPSFTADGGQTWIQPVMGKFCPDSIDIVDGRSIWLCNQFGVFTSKDGGRSLSQTYSPYDTCRILSFADDTHGWSSFDWNIAATDDGAIRWLDLEKEYNMGDIAALSRRTPEEGYVLTYDGIFWSTSDAGASWTSTDLEIVDDDMRIANQDGRPPVSMHFQDEDNGVIVLTMAGRGNTQFFSLHTADGGQSWARQEIPLNLGAVYLSHDGRFLTVTELGGQGTVTILENQTVEN